MYDIKDFKSRQKKAPVQNLQPFIQAKVEANRLTNDPAWDYYLSILKNLLNISEQERQVQLEAIVGSAVAHEDLLIIKMNHARCDARVELLNHVINLPKQIKSMGDEAKGRNRQNDPA